MLNISQLDLSQLLVNIVSQVASLELGVHVDSVDLILVPQRLNGKDAHRGSAAEHFV